MNFNDFVGNDSLKRQLMALIKNKRLSHAILLEGEKGLGKKTLAKIIAKTLVCNHAEAGLSCGVCASCLKVQKKIHPDVIYPEKSGILQSYSIATVRKIRADAYIAANESKNKVYIFSEVDNMGVPAQNALLKVLEEPPRNVIFILTCTSAANVLPTIRSRMQQMALNTVSREDLHKYLIQNYPDENLENILRMSKGNIGLALDLVASSDWQKSLEIFQKIVLGLASSKEFEVLMLIKPIFEDKKVAVSMLNFLSETLRDAMVLSVDFSFTENNFARSLSEKLSVKQILKLMEVTSLAKSYVEKNVNMSILSAFFCSSLFKIING